MKKELWISFGLILISAFFDSFAAYVIKARFNVMGRIPSDSLSHVLAYMFSFLQSPLIILGIILFFSAPALWFVALNRIDLTLAYPTVVGFHLFFIIFFGVCLLGEAMTLSRWISVGFLFISLYFLYR